MVNSLGLIAVIDRRLFNS